MPSGRCLSLIALIGASLFAGTLGACGDDGTQPATSTTQSKTATTDEGAGASALRHRLEDELRSLLEKSDSAESIGVDCVVERLRTSLSDEAVRAATEAADRGEEIPKEAVDAAFAAGQECSKR